MGRITYTDLAIGWTPSPRRSGRNTAPVSYTHLEYFGFGVDAGMGCVADIQTQAAFKTYWAKRLEEDPDIDPYNDLFCDLLEENAKACLLYTSSWTTCVRCWSRRNFPTVTR